MMKNRVIYAKWVIVIVYLVGLLGLSLPLSRDLFIDLTPLNLLFSAILLTLFHEKFRPIQFVVFLVVFVASFFIELLGVQSGLIFGGYHYGSALGLKIGETPLLIGLNWLILIYMVYHFLQDWKVSIFLKSFIGAFVMLSYDLLLEPMAPKLDFWYWLDGSIPLQNYIAWWIISFAFFIIWNATGIKYKNRIAGTLLSTQLAFFLLLNITLG
ncbi:MAG: carotenoid biosynthesis protein [Bacteroidales bacterium]|nr:carotenoid biosynthesis protein [Bacteroidales bacterium]MCF8337492.1 carotenoid biosynthesis protein [Bacteroidales bacterium]